MISKIKKLIEFFPYYLEVFAKKLSGRGIMDPEKNGEFIVLEKIIKNAKKKVCFFDGGANLGKHTLKFLSLCETYQKEYELYAVEPFPNTYKKLVESIKYKNNKILNISLGNKKEKVKFYFNSEETSGSNSTIPHHYLNNVIEVNQDTIDNIIKEFKIDKIDFLKLDIEGSELNALDGAKDALKLNLINYIQLEYNGTWINGGGSLRKVYDLCALYDYQLFIITKKHLLSIPSYHLLLDDFYFSNLLLIKKNLDKLLPVKRKAMPYI